MQWRGRLSRRGRKRLTDDKIEEKNVRKEKIQGHHYEKLPVPILELISDWVPDSTLEARKQGRNVNKSNHGYTPTDPNNSDCTLP